MARFIFGGLITMAGLAIMLVLAPLTCAGSMFAGSASVGILSFAVGVGGFMVFMAGVYIARTHRPR